MAQKLAWGIISTGAIARTFARALAKSDTGRLAAVASRSAEAAEEFGRKFGVERRHGSYEELLADGAVEAVYIATPHPYHAEWAIKAAEAGKHILCEKPIGLNFPEAMAIVEAARRNDVFLMEAFMYRCHPQTSKLVELLRERVTGDVRLIQATFSFQAEAHEESRLYNNALGGGGILDVGCYTTSIARLVAGVALGGYFAEPFEVKGTGHLGRTGVDEWAVASLSFPGGILAELSTGVGLSQENGVRIYGSEGNIFMPSPYLPSREGGTTKIIVSRKSEAPREIDITTDRWLYAIEADTVAANIERRQAPSPAMTWEDTLGNMRTLDRWRESIGLVYDSEQPRAQKRPVHGGKLRRRPEARMQYGEIAGVGKPVSRLAIGGDNQPSIAYASVMFDAFYEEGGTAFDTAYVYGGASGRSERLLGWWIKNRRLRDKVVVIDKGAHTPFCTPRDLMREHEESLERLQTDYVDLYFMHRDNPEVPVGEFIDLLNERVKAGTMRAFGASNWTLERFGRAQSYAKRKGVAGFAALSNNFSLAEMIEAVWSGCLSASDPEWRAYLEKTQTVLLPWSSQARGFFTERARSGDRSDAELARCWYSKDNFKRQARAKKLAAQKGVEPINIALAYVLAQPFPTFPIIGPRTLRELSSSLRALDVALTPEEARWLDTGE